MHEFFNLTPTNVPAVLFWYFLAIGGGLLFVFMAMRLQGQGQVVQRAQPTSGRKSRRGKATPPAPPTVDPLHHAPYWGRVGLALYLACYLLWLSFGLGLAAPMVRIACGRTPAQTVDCTVREYLWFIAPTRHAVIHRVTDVHEYSTPSSSNRLGGRPTGGATTYLDLTNGEGQTLTTQTAGTAEAIQRLWLEPATTQVIVWGRPSWLGLSISLALLLVASLIVGSWLAALLRTAGKWQQRPMAPSGL